MKESWRKYALYRTWKKAQMWTADFATLSRARSAARSLAENYGEALILGEGIQEEYYWNPETRKMRIVRF